MCQQPGGLVALQSIESTLFKSYQPYMGRWPLASQTGGNELEGARLGSLRMLPTGANTILYN
jgi:hypothetical protein